MERSSLVIQPTFHASPVTLSSLTQKYLSGNHVSGLFLDRIRPDKLCANVVKWEVCVLSLVLTYFMGKELTKSGVTSFYLRRL